MKQPERSIQRVKIPQLFHVPDNNISRPGFGVFRNTWDVLKNG